MMNKGLSDQRPVSFWRSACSYRTNWTMLLLLAASFPLSAQSVQWTDFADLADSLREEPRPLLIFIHTDWCKYCALQDQNTFGDQEVARLINKKFYALRLNAESGKSISFLNRNYQGAGDQYHELAEFLARNDHQLSFPTTIILSTTWQLEQRWTGFVSAESLIVFLD